MYRFLAYKWHIRVESVLDTPILHSLEYQCYIDRKSLVVIKLPPSSKVIHANMVTSTESGILDPAFKDEFACRRLCLAIILPRIWQTEEEWSMIIPFGLVLCLVGCFRTWMLVLAILLSDGFKFCSVLMLLRPVFLLLLFSFGLGEHKTI